MRLTRTLSAAAASAVLLVAASSATAASVTKVDCSGSVTLDSISNLSVRQAGSETFTSFDFGGRHDLCLADGSSVEAAISGHLDQRSGSDGSVSIRFQEILSYGDGTIGFAGDAAGNAAGWHSEVQTVGAGTGILAGLEAHGSFYPTGSPVVLTDQITYLYH